VIVTHKNIMANEVMIAEAFGTQPEDVGLTWLPVYHDMGLIGSAPLNSTRTRLRSSAAACSSVMRCRHNS
ncbi:hypothetical protein HN292_19035, partial [Acinetobacter baumannii]|nr:hypothetical protein [Acinetobacter baumannii]MBF6937545.1 hypothetical protein [Acinetobacter baumannii]